MTVFFFCSWAGKSIIKTSLEGYRKCVAKIVIMSQR